MNSSSDAPSKTSPTAMSDGAIKCDDNPAAEWVQRQLDWYARRGKIAPHQLTPFNRRAVDILRRAMGTGVYNLSISWGKVDWHAGDGVRFVLFTGGLSTWDFSQLTRLVILAHDECVRIDLTPVAPRYLAIMMHPRVRNGDNWSTRHPTIEEAIQAVRKGCLFPEYPRVTMAPPSPSPSSPPC